MIFFKNRSFRFVDGQTCLHWWNSELILSHYNAIHFDVLYTIRGVYHILCAVVVVLYIAQKQHRARRGAIRAKACESERERY